MATDVNSSGIVNQGANQAQETKRNDQEVNFAALRKKTEALEAQLQERDQIMHKQQQVIDQMQSRFQPAQDEFDSLPSDELIDKAKLQRIREKDRENFRKEAEQVARQTYEKLDSENFANKLKVNTKLQSIFWIGMIFILPKKTEISFLPRPFVPAR